MNARPGRPPKTPTGETATLTLRVRSEIKRKLMEDAEAVDMSMTEYLATLVEKGI